MTAVNVSSLNQYAQHLFDLLHLLRIYKSEKVFSLLARLSTGILIIICLVANLVLVISELIGLKDAKNVKQLARGIGAVSFHTTGIVKWCYCMWKIDIITNLINMLYYCHYLSLQICQNVQGNFFVVEYTIWRIKIVWWNLKGFSSFEPRLRAYF